MPATSTATAPAAHVARERSAAYFLGSPASVQGRAFGLSALERVHLIKQGVPARTVQEMSAAMGLPRDQLMRAVGLARSTVERKIAARARLSEGRRPDRRTARAHAGNRQPLPGTQDADGNGRDPERAAGLVAGLIARMTRAGLA